jgi:hypothetical protein
MYSILRKGKIRDSFNQGDVVIHSPWLNNYI